MKQGRNGRICIFWGVPTVRTLPPGGSSACRKICWYNQARAGFWFANRSEKGKKQRNVRNISAQSGPSAAIRCRMAAIPFPGGFLSLSSENGFPRSLFTSSNSSFVCRFACLGTAFLACFFRLAFALMWVPSTSKCSCGTMSSKLANSSCPRFSAFFTGVSISPCRFPVAKRQRLGYNKRVRRALCGARSRVGQCA